MAAVTLDHCSVRWAGTSALVRLPAEIDISNAGAIGAGLQAVLGQGALSVFVDMTGTSFCDCSGVAALIGAYVLAKRAGAEFRLAASAPAVRRIFGLTGADRLFDIHPSLSSAFSCEPARLAAALPQDASALWQDSPVQDSPAPAPPAATPSLSRGLRRLPPAAAAAAGR